MNLNLAELEEKKKHVLSIQRNTYRQVQGGGGSGLGAGRQGSRNVLSLPLQYSVPSGECHTSRFNSLLEQLC